ncbi:MAG: DoxX family protein [Cytophagales bacterium]|nr:DoxX family protein [Cytophagales bacterium]
MNPFKGQSFKRRDLSHWIPRLIVAIIIAQTLPAKFLAVPESVWIFDQLNMEPGGRIIIAIFELIAVVALVSRHYIIGAIISLSIISAANFYHFTVLGLEVNNDGGLLFIFSIIVVMCSLWVVMYWNLFHNSRKARLNRLEKENIYVDHHLIEEDADLQGK